MRIGSHTVELSHTEKLLFPDDGITKGDLIDYYHRIAETMLPHIQGRPVMLQRFPNGIAKPGFVQKEAPNTYPDWIPRVKVPKEGGRLTEIVCDDAATLIFLANQDCITPHVWLSRADRLDTPDRMIFDLDPPGDDFALARDAAIALRKLLEDSGLPAFVMATGSRGLHVLVPLKREHGFEAVRHVAQQVAGRLAQSDPGRYTTEMRKEARQGRLFLDTFRNGYAQTAVPPYAVRPKPGAPVATPLEWSELDDLTLTAHRYTLRTVFARLKTHPDPWRDLGVSAAPLPK